ncbi:uncharacterized protein LOC111363292 [Spodoptera litura]|uniref:Uncharacterized protein LOC111363292 n=1 Tax=Spodoptera litura TaxID=69820 RepID=A0A9J7EUU4_SPOLT|nr:uncharacterized protein LOC111363292 [Spodoptera litura]
MKLIVTLLLVVALVDLFHCTPTDRKADYVIDNSSSKDPEDKPVPSSVTEKWEVAGSAAKVVNLDDSVPVKTHEEAKSPVATAEPTTSNGFLSSSNTENTSSPKYHPQQQKPHPQLYSQENPQLYPQIPDTYFVYPVAYPQPYLQQYTPVVEYSQLNQAPGIPRYSVLVL